MAPKVNVYHTGVILFTNTHTRALLLDLRSSTDPRIPDHTPYLRFPLKQWEAAGTDVPLDHRFDAVDPLDGQLKTFGAVILDDHEVSFENVTGRYPLQRNTTPPA